MSESSPEMQESGRTETAVKEKLKILFLQGPNLNLLGSREESIYGSVTLDDLHLRLESEAHKLRVETQFFQSNIEGALVDRIHEAMFNEVDGIVINPAAYTHTSIALRDAFAAVRIPFVEIHISNVHARESFRHSSYITPLAAGLVVGFGIDGYRLALHGIVNFLRGDTEMWRNP